MDAKLREEVAELHAQLCGALADPNRILILYILADCSCNVSDIADRLGLSQPTVSRHLKTLRERGLVSAAREGQSVFYTLNDRRVIEALNMLRELMADQLRHRTSLARRVKEPLAL